MLPFLREALGESQSVLRAGHCIAHRTYSKFTGSTIDSNMDNVQGVGRGGNSRSRVRLDQAVHKVGQTTLFLGFDLVAVALSRADAFIGGVAI